jgi:hypothetical protein
MYVLADFYDIDVFDNLPYENIVRPIGYDWKKWWRISDNYNDYIGFISTCLSEIDYVINEEPTIFTPIFKQITKITKLENGLYEIYFADKKQIGVTFAYFCTKQFSSVIATHPNHKELWKKMVDINKPQATFIG